MTTPRELQDLQVADIGAAEYRMLLERGQELGEHGIWVWYEDAQKSAWSPNARRILGHGAEDAVWLFDLVHPDDQAIRSYDTFAASAEPKTVEYRIFRHSDRALRWIRETGVAELDANGKPIRIIGSITDITERRPGVPLDGRRLAEAEGRERLEIERDLHDGAQQRLVALQISINRLRRDAAGTSIDDGLAELDHQISMAHAELRRVSHGIYPPVLLAAGLSEAIRELPAPRTLSVQVVDEGIGRLDPASERALYFATSEAVQNTTKHARATSVTVTLHRSDGAAGVTVADDGVGFSLGDVQGGTGIAGMRDRIQQLDGTVEIESTPGEGTTVVFSLPPSPRS